jgi:uncharacterized protein
VLSILTGLFALSISAGFIGALSGLGGGVFIVPGLVILAHIPMHIAIGASLISVVATSAGASVAFVRDGWTNLRVAIILECATVTGAVLGAYMAGLISPPILEMMFAFMMLQSAWFAMKSKGEAFLPQSDALCTRLRLGGQMPGDDGVMQSYGVVNLPGGASLMVVAGLLSGLLGIGAGAVKVTAMDFLMKLPLKVSSATSNFMIGVTAGAGALVYLSRGDVAATVAAPVALGVAMGALIGGRVLPRVNTGALRKLFVVILVLIAIEMGWRAFSKV